MSRDSRARGGNIARPWRCVVLSAFVLAGCATMQNGDGTYLLRAINRSNEIVQEVVIKDADGKERAFGMMAERGKEQAIRSCPIMLNRYFVIMWYFNGKRGVRFVDLTKYFPYKDQIDSFTFSYEGQYEWSVVARNAAGAQIKPSAATAKPKPPAKTR